MSLQLMTQRIRDAALCLAIAALAAIPATTGAAAASTIPDTVPATTTDSQPAAGTDPVTAPVALPSAPVEAEADGYNPLTARRLLGEWDGARQWLEDHGFSIMPVFYNTYEQNFRGGRETHNADAWSGNMQYNMEFDFGKMGLVPGGSFFIRGLQTWNTGTQKEIGSLGAPAWVIGSADDYEILVDKWWWRQRFLDDRIELRLGKLLSVIDLFDCNEYASNIFDKFMNRAFGTASNVPVTRGIGGYLKVWPADGLYFSIAGMDADQRLTRTGFDTAFHGTAHFRGYSEIGLLPHFFNKDLLPGNYRAGVWYDPQDKREFQNTLGGRRPEKWETDDVGFYCNFDQKIWKEPGQDAKGTQGLGIFARYGYARQHVNRINHAWSTGLEYQGLIDGRDRDLLGFGVAQNVISERYRNHVDDRADRETIYELYYNLRVTQWLSVTPDFQVITNPGGSQDARDAIFGGIRFRIVF